MSNPATGEIVIVGAGAMGSALASAAVAAGVGSVTLIGSPLDDDIIDAIAAGKPHPQLEVLLPKRVLAVKNAAVDDRLLSTAQMLVIAVSSPGIDWITQRLVSAAINPAVLALATRGLPAIEGAVPQTYAHTLSATLSCKLSTLVSIGGPCLARELALGLPTRVSFASTNRLSAMALRDCLQSDFFRITLSDDLIGFEACGAVKNFLCIGVSAMLSRYQINGEPARNPLAALYNQAVLEMVVLAHWIRGDAQAGLPGVQTVVFDLAGMGDLHVTVGGGRNGRLGRYLGERRTLASVMRKELAGATVEGLDTGRRLVPAVRAACTRGDLDASTLPLTLAILDSIEHDAVFEFDIRSLPG